MKCTCVHLSIRCILRCDEWRQISIQINDKRAAGVLKRLHQDGQGYVATFLSKDQRKDADGDRKDKDPLNASNGLSQVLDFFAYPEQDSKFTVRSSSRSSKYLVVS